MPQALTRVEAGARTVKLRAPWTGGSTPPGLPLQRGGKGKRHEMVRLQNIECGGAVSQMYL